MQDGIEDSFACVSLRCSGAPQGAFVDTLGITKNRYSQSINESVQFFSRIKKKERTYENNTTIKKEETLL